MTREHIETNDPRIIHDESGMISEASTLEFPVGYWPHSFITSDGHVFRQVHSMYDDERELVGFKYRDDATKGDLIIFND